MRKERMMMRRKRIFANVSKFALLFGVPLVFTGATTPRPPSPFAAAATTASFLFFFFSSSSSS